MINNNMFEEISIQFTVTELIYHWDHMEDLKPMESSEKCKVCTKLLNLKRHIKMFTKKACD